MFYFKYGSIVLTGLRASIGVTHSYSSRLFLCALEPVHASTLCGGQRVDCLLYWQQTTVHAPAEVISYGGRMSGSKESFGANCTFFGCTNSARNILCCWRDLLNLSIAGWCLHYVQQSSKILSNNTAMSVQRLMEPPKLIHPPPLPQLNGGRRLIQPRHNTPNNVIHNVWVFLYISTTRTNNDS